MSQFPIERYKFYVNEKNHEVIAVSSYCGRVVRGVAKCDPRDDFSVESGKKLAATRCNAKIAAKREKRAHRKLNEASQQLEAATAFYKKMQDYAERASEDAFNATLALEKLVESL